MDANELKQHIIDNDLIPTFLECMGCNKIKQSKEGYRSSKPNGDNPTSLSIMKDGLFVTIFSDNFKGNIYSFIMEYKNFNFGEAIRWLHSIYHLKYDYHKKDKFKKKSPLTVFHKIKTKKKKEIYNPTIYEEDVLYSYYPYLYIDWVKEGINERARNKFDIHYDYIKKRIVIPHKKWDSGDILGVMSRTTLPNFEIFNIPKYFPIIAHNKGNNLYGLYENYIGIQKEQMVIVYEAEKSVLKRYSFFDGRGVACCCHELTNEQVKILIGLNVSITIAFDNDVKEEEIWKTCEKFYRIRTIYYIKDKSNILGEKDSPADTNLKNFEILFQNKIKYDIIQHERYEEYLKKEKDKKRRGNLEYE